MKTRTWANIGFRRPAAHQTHIATLNGLAVVKLCPILCHWKVKMKVTDKIINSEIVIDHFGYWPTFHDATINRVIFHTLPTYKYAITIFITAFEMTNQVNQEGYYQLDKECVIEMEFSGIQELVYEDFNFQNVAFEILFTEEKNMIKCEISPSTGLYAIIKSDEVVIINLQKLDKENKDKKTA